MKEKLFIISFFFFFLRKCSASCVWFSSEGEADAHLYMLKNRKRKEQKQSWGWEKGQSINFFFIAVKNQKVRTLFFLSPLFLSQIPFQTEVEHIKILIGLHLCQLLPLYFSSAAFFMNCLMP